MAEGGRSFRAVAAAQRGFALPTEDLIFALVPLMRAVAALHAQGLVAALGADDVIEDDEGIFVLARPAGQVPRIDAARLDAVQPHAGSALKIVGEYRVTTDIDEGSRAQDLQTQTEGAEIVRPVYLTGYRSWEREIGHHDEVTDVFALGLMLASLACGLDLGDPADVERLSAHRVNLFRLHRGLHPVVAGLIRETTALNRHERATDLAAIAQRLETYRDQPVGPDVDRVLEEARGAPSRRTAVLAHLRDRLFDLSRRNRLVYFRPTQASINLTVASVPIVVRLEAIRPDDLCTWGGAFAQEVLGGAPLPLSKWLRFEDQPYLPSALDRISQSVRRDRTEYGFSHLRLVVAFLHWNNLKEAPDERIVSPLLWLPVEVTKKKGVRDQYMLRCPDTEAEFNPALRHHLRQLYDLQLPETVDLAETDLAAVHADLLAQIQASEPGITVGLQTRPAIRLTHQRAVQRMRQYQRRRGRELRDGAAKRPDFSYDRDDYRPLGLAMFEKMVRPSPLPQRSAVGAPLPPRPEMMTGEAESSTYSLVRDDGHRYAWEIDLTEVTLANFNYRKMSLVRDYARLIDGGAELPSFDRVFSIEPRPIDDAPPPPLPPDQHWGVLPADATQTAASALARSGRSFIIQGPPGTGKSQTITNLIADFAARGKRVLFVCEKRAALDVVFHRLRQVGLDHLCCLIHDSQEDKRAFVQDLKSSYETWVRDDDELDKREAARRRTLDALTAHLQRIAAFDDGMGRVRADMAGSLRARIRHLAALPASDPPTPAVGERLPTPAQWDGSRDLVARVRWALSNQFGLHSLAQHVFARLSSATTGSDQAYAQVDAALAEAEALLDRLDPVLQDDATHLDEEMTLRDARNLVCHVQSALESNLAGNLDLLDPASPASRAFAESEVALDHHEAERAVAAEKARHWQDPLVPEDTRAALEQARRLESKFFRFLSGSWRRLKKIVASRYVFSGHAVRPTLVSVLEWLDALQCADAACRSAADSLRRTFTLSDLATFRGVRAEIAKAAAADPALAELIADARAAADPVAVLAREGQAAATIEALAALAGRHLDEADDLTLAEIAEVTRDMRESLDELPDLLPLLRTVRGAGGAMAFALLSLPVPVGAVESLVIREGVQRVLRAEPELQRINGVALASSARRAARAQELLAEANAAVIRATVHRRFRDNVKRAMISVTQLDGEGKRFKKRYAAGRRDLEHEFGKTMRYRAIRELADGDTGLVVKDLKPVWLMSPLSVSDTLPIDDDVFDVIIFDEASQIPVEDAVPALCRAGQVIVVGDEMQLPPTSFFSAALDPDELRIDAEEEGDSVSILLDADSLLNQAARNLSATMLAWHYRSRSETLISFSNAAFYNGQLVTIPDRRLIRTENAPEPLQSHDVDAARAAADRLLACPLSFHRVADGVYEDRINEAEAAAIAGILRELLARSCGLSIGIVAFSEAQQGEIESALDAVADTDAEFAEQLEREYSREDDGQFNGLFVKNLENVQGDERDIIILSICYAPGRNGRMVMNFGPINQRGGERRLNVIFSRARHHMAVVSTITGDDITNIHNDGALALKTFLAFADAQSRGAQELGQGVLATLNPDARRIFAREAPEDSVRSAIAAALRARGHVVHEHVGSASFRCDLAVLDADGGGYGLAILLDPLAASGAPETAERFVFRPKVLRNFGWRVLDIPSLDWLRHPDGVIARIEAALQQRDDQTEDDDPFGESAPAPAAVPARAVPAAVPTPAALSAPDAETREFRFQQGASAKFWKVTLAGTDVTVTFGRIGAKGQSVAKTYDTVDRARREADKLIAEKLRKGYVEIE